MPRERVLLAVTPNDPVPFKQEAGLSDEVAHSCSGPEFQEGKVQSQLLRPHEGLTVFKRSKREQLIQKEKTGSGAFFKSRIPGRKSWRLQAPARGALTATQEAEEA